MNQTKVAIASHEAETAARRAIEGDGADEDVVRAAFEAARSNWLAPDDGEALAAGIAALVAVWPERKAAILQEAAAIGSFNKLMLAIENGIPVDFEAWEPEPMPENPLGLLQVYRSCLGVA